MPARPVLSGHRAVGRHPDQDGGQTLSELNTTPLIDVMLVLLVMFIVTIPVQSHAVKLDLPTQDRAHRLVLPVSNLLTIDAEGILAWNGAAIGEAELPALLRAMQHMQPEPELHLRPDAATRYDVVDRTLATIKRSGVRRFGFVGNEAYRQG